MHGPDVGGRIAHGQPGLSLGCSPAREEVSRRRCRFAAGHDTTLPFRRGRSVDAESNPVMGVSQATWPGVRWTREGDVGRTTRVRVTTGLALALVVGALSIVIGDPPRRPVHRCRVPPTARCSRPTTSGTPTSRRCRSTATAARGWPACAVLPPTSTRTSARPVTRPTPTGCPTPWSPHRTRWSPRPSCMHRRAIPGPIRSGLTPRSRVAPSPPGTAMPSWSTRPACTLYELDNARCQRLDGHRWFRGHVEPQFECPAASGLDVGRRRRATDPPRTTPLRRGAVGIDHPCHPDDRPGDGHLLSVARSTRGRELEQTPAFPHGGPVPARRQLRHLRLLPAGASRPAGHAALRSDSGRQRVQLVLRWDR